MSKSIMIQGTMSNAGKSFFAAALCRIFKQDGFSCAPFKSQNMALNSYITADGSEIGRAQAMQAEAAGILPIADMNPILLKPTTDIGSQVILNGNVIGNMTAYDYFRSKTSLIPYIQDAYNRLSAKHDIIVIEGAGSPVELNLKSDDIANMSMAKIAKSPVLLIGDIDRGGIFPQLLGTLSLLENDEINMVKGLVVNKFRGDIELFRDGTEILESRGRKPVLGVIPFIRCDIEDEDSLSDKLNSNLIGLIDIVVIRLPRMSNFTDFDVFSQYKDVSVRYVSKYNDIGDPDFIIIPGTKSSIADMKWMRESGMEIAIKRAVNNGIPIFGICGGYQILGEKIYDMYNSEGGGEIDGMGLLPCDTEFLQDKTTIQTAGKFSKVEGFFSCLSEVEFEGYEIHMGQTFSRGMELTNIGGCQAGNVYGSYVHGIFDNSEVSRRIVKRLFQKKGLNMTEGESDRKTYKERQFDILADEVRKSLNMELLYKIVEEGLS